MVWVILKFWKINKEGKGIFMHSTQMWALHGFTNKINLGTRKDGIIPHIKLLMFKNKYHYIKKIW
jgi:hypothetical protein